jgi:uncharacterized protein
MVKRMNMAKQRAEEIIKLYKLEPLTIEGGYFRETYRSTTVFNTEIGPRNACTHIYYLLKEEQVSKLHRVRSDEIWHFYSGDPITIIDISPDGKLKKEVLGSSIPEQKSEYLFPKGHWFGAHLDPKSGWALLGCTVSPGFEYSDFELGNREQLIRLYPNFKEYIIKLT